MKRRIEKLFNEAGFHKPEVERLGIEHKFEKFAELIVKECAEVINSDIDYQVKDGIISNVHGLNQARNLIKEHFGVEE